MKIEESDLFTVKDMDAIMVRGEYTEKIFGDFMMAAAQKFNRVVLRIGREVSLETPKEWSRG